MEGIVAKRTLKKSYYNKGNAGNIISTIDDELLGRKTKGKKYSQVKQDTFKEKLFYKISLQAITMISIIVFVTAIKYFNIEIVTKSDAVKKLITEYNKTYTLNQITRSIKDKSLLVYKIIKPIVPKSIENKFIVTYNAIINKNTKPEQLLKDKEVQVYEESNNNKSKDTEENEETVNNGVGGAVDIAKGNPSLESSISSENNIVGKIKNTGVLFVKPVSGVITSRFGAREVIFQGVDSYHTGTDIATSVGTSVVSSTDGKITVATYNKYNGNFVEVTNGKIVTKYCHLSKISVKEGNKIKSGEKLGEVGSTGLSTGPHLHFEIVYSGTKINPELILKL